MSNRSKTVALFDHLVGAGEQRGRRVETKGPRGLEVDGQLVFGRRLHQQVGRFLALENAIDITAAGHARQGGQVSECLTTSVPVRQRNGGGEHTVRIETAFQRSQASPVAAVSIPGLFAIMWRQLVGVAAG